MIQDIFPHKLINTYDKNAVAEEEDFVFCFRGNEILVKSNSDLLEFPTVGEMPKQSKLTYLITVDRERYFLCNVTEVCPEGYEYKDFRAVRHGSVEPKYRIYAAITGKHLFDWYRDTQFCGRCGKKMEHSTTERAMTCSECGYTAYPRIMPAVIVGVTQGDKLLLTQYREGFSFNALIAGFVEIGETVEETVAREVMEEAGIHVKNIRYYKSQPWGVANDILMGFYCDVDGDPTIHMDTRELKIAHWVERDEIELQPDDFSLTNEMMKMFKEGRQ